MTDREYHRALLLIAVAILLLLVAIPVTLYLQQQSVIEVVRDPVSESAAVVQAEVEQAPSVVPEESFAPTEESAPLLIPEGYMRFVEVIDACGPHFEGECLRVRSGPGLEYPVVASLRTGVVLKVEDAVKGESYDWFPVVFDEWLRYPERVSGEWYVAAPYVREVWDAGPLELQSIPSTTDKRIVVDRSDQTLIAYEGDSVIFDFAISTGLELSPTPRGEFTIFRKTPTRYMQGPLPYLPVSKYYDLPGVPWNLYFTEQGAVIHGTYWHDSFGAPYSSGCVNVRPAEAEELYRWADLGTTVIVRD